MANLSPREWLTTLGTLTARPTAFLIVVVYAVLWAWLEPESLDWHGFATLATWLMTLFIQRAEHRDTQAIHVKLDELISANAAANDAVQRVDDDEPEEIEKRRSERPHRAN